MYHYDTDEADPFALEHPSRHNRLLYWELFDVSGEGDVLLRTVRYTYYQTGAVSNITIQDEYLDTEATPGDPADYERRHDLALYYYSNGQLWRAQWSAWAVDANGDPIRLSQRDDGGISRIGRTFGCGGVRALGFNSVRFFLT